MTDLSSKKIGIVGNCYFDEIYRIERFPKPDDKVTAKDMTVTLGGSATNTAAGLVKLGIKPILLSAIGNDTSGEQIINELELRNIDHSYLSKIDGQTGRTIILLDENKNSTKIGYPGVCGDLKRVFIKNNPFRNKFDMIHLASVDIETAQFVVKDAEFEHISLDFGARTLNSSNDTIIDFMEKIDLAFLNRNVFRRLYPKFSLSLEDLAAIEFPCNIVLTAGEGGIFAKVDKKLLYQPIFPVNVVDTTGAGDASAASIIKGILENWPWEKNLKYAAANAAIKLQTYGASNGHPTIELIEEFIKLNL